MLLYFDIQELFVPLRCKKHNDKIMALEIAVVPVLTGEASDRFEQMMEQSEERRGSVDFSREINEARAILSKANL